MITFILDTFVATFKQTISIIPSRVTSYRRMLSKLLDYKLEDPRRLARLFYFLSMLISYLLFDFHFLQLIVTLSLPPLGTPHLLLFAFNLFIFNFLIEASGLMQFFREIARKNDTYTIFSVPINVSGFFSFLINILRATLLCACDPALFELICPYTFLWLSEPSRIAEVSRDIVQDVDYCFPIINYPLYFTVDSLYIGASAILGLFFPQRPISDQQANTIYESRSNHDNQHDQNNNRNPSPIILSSFNSNKDTARHNAVDPTRTAAANKI